MRNGLDMVTRKTVDRVFRYGTHKQLENSVKRWLANGTAIKTQDKWYEVKDKSIKNTQEIEISVRDGALHFKAGAVIVMDNNGWWLLGATV